jgi:hypothetical protein
MSSMNAVREPRTFHPIYPIVDAGYTLIDAGHSVIDASHPIIDASHSIVDDKHIVRNFPDFAIDGIRDLQELRRGHSSLLLRQPVQSLQRILDLVISNQFLD